MTIEEREAEPFVDGDSGRISVGRPVGKVKRMSAGRISVHNVNFGIPTNDGAKEHVMEEHGDNSWSAKVLHILHDTKVQIALMLLLFLDVLILFTEIFLLAAYPPCQIIKRDCISCCEEGGANRFLSAASDEPICESGLEPDFDTGGCDESKHATVHQIEQILFALTMTILFTFFIELNLEMIALRPWIFCRQFFYFLDYVIITVSIVLEMFFHFASQDTLQTLAGLLVVIRIWRFVRIGHGIVEISAEWTHHQYSELLEYTEELEAILTKQGMKLPESGKKINRGSHASSSSHSKDKIGELDSGTKFYDK